MIFEINKIIKIVLILFINSNLTAGIIEIPLNKMIEKSDYIVRGTVIKTEKADTVSINKLRSYSKHWKTNKVNCSGCSEIATVVVEKCLYGQVEKDTIEMVYKHGFMSAYDPPISGFKVGREYILFLGKIESLGYYARMNSRFGSRWSKLNALEDLIHTYLLLGAEKDKRKWLIETCTQPNWTYDLMRNFQYSKPHEFTAQEKKILTKGLINLDFDTNRYSKLLELVHHFGKNNTLIKKCLSRLKKIDEARIYEGLDLMRAIYKMNPTPEYKTQIDSFDSNLSDIEKLDVIKMFLQVK